MGDSSPSHRIPGLRDSVPGAAYKKGDVIGEKYEVYGILGKGGFGIVYLVYHDQTESVYALKTFQDECLADTQARERFRKEASVWVDLERHPYLVRAYFVDQVAARLFIAMEFIAPDERGLNSLDDYLRQRPPDLAQSLRWGIQFCYGMEYAYSRSVRCHRDIKPANIMIDRDKVVRITDFGLAGVFGSTGLHSDTKLSAQRGEVGVSGQTLAGTGFGTPEYMPPEQFTDAASCDVRSDVYSFGVVVFQMASAGRLPFVAPRTEMQRLHSNAPVPKLNSPLNPIIHRCMVKEPGKRYQSFRELRRDLEPLLRRETGEAIGLPEPRTLATWEWGNKGLSLDSLGRYEEAIRCYDRVIESSPRDARTWCNKGVSLGFLGRLEEAIGCYDRALEFDPRNTATWISKGFSLRLLGRFEEAMRCYDKAIELDLGCALAWSGKARCQEKLGLKLDAARSYRQFVALASAEHTLLAELARQRIRELEGL
jgi:serine/threonine protein kinase